MEQTSNLETFKIKASRQNGFKFVFTLNSLFGESVENSPLPFLVNNFGVTVTIELTVYENRFEASSGPVIRDAGRPGGPHRAEEATVTSRFMGQWDF